MPALANLRHERFARVFIKTGVAAEAYRQAGYQVTTRNSLDACASRMLRHAKVKSRIGELRRQMSYKTRVSLETLLSDADEARKLAQEVKNPGAMIQATTLSAKLLGLLVDRREEGQPGDFSSLASTEEIIARARSMYGEALAAALASVLDKVETAVEIEEVPLPVPQPSPAQAGPLLSLVVSSSYAN